MQPDAFQTFLRAVPMPAVAIGTDEKIVAMNDGSDVVRTVRGAGYGLI